MGITEKCVYVFFNSKMVKATRDDELEMSAQDADKIVEATRDDQLKMSASDTEDA